LDYKNNRNKAHVTKECTVKLKKIPTDEESIVMLKDCKTKECKKQIAEATLEDMRKEVDLSKDGRTCLRGLQFIGNKK
jgi:hypothetical protein